MKDFETLISGDRYQYMDLHVFPLIQDKLFPICEIGVYKGGSLAHFAKAFPDRDIIGIDTFEGLPEPTEADRVKNILGFEGHKKGDFSDVKFEALKSLFDSLFGNVTLIKGLFPSESVLEQIKGKTFSFVHVDVDLYKSVKNCCEYFYPCLCKGGVMIFDDYGFKSCPGAKSAVNEYFGGRTDCIKRALNTGQYFVLKMK